MRKIFVCLAVICCLFSLTQVNAQEDQETHEFQADVARLMDIIINSLYTHKDVFLRELISNASDALDKVKYWILTQDPDYDSGALEIKIEYDPEEKTFAITDTGIGMTKDHLVKYLGSVAKSGTTNFIEAISQSQGDMNLIGQFGVGFYSVFLVADKVEVFSKNDDDDQYIWSSQAGGTYVVSKDPEGNTLKRGTRIVLHLKQDAEEFLEKDEVEKIIEKYSMFINYPIYHWVSKQVEKEVPLTEEEIVEQEAAEAAKKESGADSEDLDEDQDVEDDDDLVDLEDDEEEKTPPEEKPKTKTIKEEVFDWELINDQKPIWMRSKEELEKKDYNEFYKATTSDYNDPLAHEHFTAEGEISFRALIYVPYQSPQDLFQDYSKKSAPIKLYVRRVLISDSFDDLVPRYLSFVTGVIDSDDLPLNVARENLQQQKVMKLIGKKLTRKTIAMIKSIATPEDVEIEPEKPEEEMTDEEKEAYDQQVKDAEEENAKKAEKDYEQFWKEFGKNIKLGVIEDAANRNKLAKIVRFYSTNDNDKLTSLDQYKERMKDDQSEIYYLAGTDKEQLKSSPFIQKAMKQGYEVLLLDDPIDEYCLSHLQEYDGTKLANAAKSDTKFGDSAANKEVRLKEMYKPLTKWWKEALDKEVDKVIVSMKLETAPLVVTTGEHGWTANMERIQRAQALGSNTRSHDHMKAKKTLEINPSHPIIKDLLKRVQDDDTDEKLAQHARLLFHMGLMQSGFLVSDTNALGDMVQGLVADTLGVADQPIEEPDLGEEEEEEEAEEDLSDDGADGQDEEDVPSYEEDSQQEHKQNLDDIVSEVESQQEESNQEEQAGQGEQDDTQTEAQADADAEVKEDL